MKPHRISRRFVLRGLGGIGVALPLLDIMERPRQARAQAAAPTRRFIVFYEQTGIIYNQWKPTGSGTSFTLSPTLAPLAPLQSKINVIDGLTNKAATGPGDDHQKGMGTMLTGIELVGPTTKAPTAGGISIDQAVASGIGATSKFKSLEFGVQSGTGNIVNYSSHRAAGQPNPMTDDPAMMYARIFGSFTAPTGGTTGPDPALARLVNERKSVLDAVLGSYDSLVQGGKVSALDKTKLDAHATSIRALERQLVLPPSTTVTSLACSKPAAPATINARTGSNFPKIGQLQLDLLAMAHICDLTRVSVIQFSRESADPVYSWIAGANITRGHHAISHDADSNTTSQSQLAAIDRWHAEQLAYLLGKLDAAKEGAASVLDNALVLWVNGLAKGNFHSHGPTPPQPVVTAGSAGGALATGRYITVARGLNTNNLYVSCLNAMGIPATTFGNPAHCKGPLAGL